MPAMPWWMVLILWPILLWGWLVGKFYRRK